VNNYTFTNVTANHSIAASFRAATVSHTITASAGVGGTIDPSGVVSVDDASSRTFAIAPAPGYTIADVLVDGLSVGPVGVYPFVNVTADHTISAIFKRLPAARVRNWQLWE
jgi:hypothetical protein